MCSSYSQSTMWNRNTSVALMCEQHWFCCYCLAHTCHGYFSLLHVQSSGWFGAGFQTKEKMHRLQGNSVRGCRQSATMCVINLGGGLKYLYSQKVSSFMPWDSKSGCRSSFSFTESTQESIVHLEKLTHILYIYIIIHLLILYIHCTGDTIYLLNTLPFKM